jgi:hypothetical protein
MSFETCLRLANNDNLQGCAKYVLVQRKKRQIIEYYTWNIIIFDKKNSHLKGDIIKKF